MAMMKPLHFCGDGCNPPHDEWCDRCGCIVGFHREVEAENERLRAALESIGTDCRYEANEKRCALVAEGGVPEWRWCGGCAAWAALNPEKAEWRT